jgi:enoyl-CoA hydratase/carnithine racemase
MLQVGEEAGVVVLRVDEAVGAGVAADRLGWELLDACQAIEQREEWLAGVVLVGGGRGFWVEAPGDAEACDALAEVWPEAVAAVGRLTPPTLAVIGADAIGPAWELALACDLRIISTDARVGSPEVRLGRVPTAGATQRLRRLVGAGLALRLVLLGEVLPAAEAHALRLVHRLVDPPDLDVCVAEVLAGLRASAPIALAYAKETVHQAMDLPLDDGLRLEADLAALLHTTRDRAEGISAFLERRAARFEGR